MAVAAMMIIGGVDTGGGQMRVIMDGHAIVRAGLVSLSMIDKKK